MPPKPKTDAEKAQLRTRIIDAARELFVTRGVEAVTMREIAKGIGYSATSIYSYFADKESLLRAICETDFLGLAEALKEILKIADPVERLKALGKGYAQFALQYPNHYRLMFMTPAIPPMAKCAGVVWQHPEQDAYFQLQTVVKDAFLAQKFRADLQDAELIAQTVWAGIHGVCSLEITLAQDPWVQWAPIAARLQLMQDVLLRGLLGAQNPQ